MAAKRTKEEQKRIDLASVERNLQAAICQVSYYDDLISKAEVAFDWRRSMLTRFRLERAGADQRRLNHSRTKKRIENELEELHNKKD